jgi:hypothetical protein
VASPETSPAASPEASPEATTSPTGVAVTATESDTAPQPAVTVSEIPGEIVKGTVITFVATTEPVQPLMDARLERRVVPDGAWGTVRTGTTDAAGTVSFSARPNSYRTFDFRVVIASTPELTSQTRTVTVVETLPPEPAPDTPSVGLTVTDLPGSITKGEAVSITATTDPALPGTDARLERRVAPDGAWGTVRTATTDDAGTVSFSARPNSYRTFDFRVVIEADPPLTSRTQSVQVVSGSAGDDQQVTVSDVPARITKGDTLTFRVGTDPAAAGVTARLQRRASGGSWATVRSVTLSSTGAGTMTAAPNSTKTFEFRVVVATSPAATSRVQTVRVVAAATTSPTSPTFASSVSAVKPSQVTYSHRSGCPVAISSLRNLRVSYYDYGGAVRHGTVVVRAGAVDAVRAVFRRAFKQKFPFKIVRPLEYYYAGGSRSPHDSDVAAMNAGNTGAFNCRPVVGNPYRMSQHSYGNAIDYNTIQNPYVTPSRVYPDAGRQYLDRSRYRTGMILPGSVVASTMSNWGWPWGARWAHPDYQHFSSNGG